VGKFDDSIALGLQGRNSKGSLLPKHEARDVKFEAEVAQSLHDKLVSFRRGVRHPTEARIAGEIDIETPNFIIDATMGRASTADQVGTRLTNSIVNPQNKPIVVVAPRLKNSAKTQNTIEVGASTVVHSVDELLEFLAKNGGA